MSTNNNTISTTSDSNAKVEIYSWGRIYTSPNPPAIMIDSITKDTLLSTNDRYPEIYYLMQDRHISHHREFYNKYQEEMINFSSWNKLKIPAIDRYYMLVLKERFEPDRNISTTLNIWYKYFKKYAELYIGICNVCGFYKLGACREDVWKEPILLQFEY